MTDINSLMEDIGIAAFETGVKIASLALISVSGKILHQSKNWDLTAQTKDILDVVKGKKELFFNNVKFSVIKKEALGIVATNERGMGSIVMIPFRGAILLSYVMPGANTDAVMDFLLPYTKKMSEFQ